MKENNEIKSGALKVQMSISYSICAEVQAERNIWTVKKRYWRNIEKIMRTERGRNNRSRSMSGSHTYARKYSTLYKYSTIYGISQG